MSYSIKIDHPAFPKDHEFAIDGLGLFKNGTSRKIDEEAEQAYKNLTGKTVKEGLKAEYVKVDGSSETKGGGES